MTSQEQLSANNFFYIPSKGKLIPVSNTDEALNSLKNGGFIWLNFFEPSKKDLAKLIEPLGIHPLAIEDSLDDEKIPKINDYHTHTFLIFNSFSYDNHAISTSEIDIFLAKNYLIVVSHDKNLKSLLFDKLHEIVNVDLNHATMGTDFLLHMILDYIVDHKFHVIEALEDELNVIEENIVKAPSNFKPQSLMKIRHNLLTLRKSLIHERETLIKICRKDSPFISDKAIYHFRDIYDHLTRFYESAEISREMVSNLMEMYLSMINNQMTMLANKTNIVVRRLTLLTTIFMPLTLIAGIGGMSEWSMMTGPHNWKIAYPIFIFIMAVIGVLNYQLFKRLGFSEKKKN